MVNRLVIILAAVVTTLVIANPKPARAQSIDPSCARFVTIVDLIGTIAHPNSEHENRRLDTLAAQVQMLDLDKLYTQISKAGYSELQPTVTGYLKEIRNFLQIRRISTNATGQILFGRPQFAQRHQTISKMSTDLCTENASDKGIGEKITEWLGLSDSGISPVSAATQNSSTSRGFGLKLDKQSRMLAQVFGILAIVLLGLYALNYLTKILNAIRLDRYTCQIPVTLKTAEMHFNGIIDVLGNRGLSFSVSAPVTDQHYKFLTLDTPVSFVTDNHEFAATLTKEFDGSAGFKLSVPLNKSLLRRLLSASRTKPRVKLEMGRRK